MKILILLAMVVFRAYSPGSHVMTVIGTEAIRPHEAVWNATCKVESNFNPFAVGDKHLSKHSYGIAQIRQSRLDDYYRETGIRYTIEDMFIPEKAKQVFMYYAHPDNEITARTWNGGSKGMEKSATLEYWKLIKSNL